MSEGVALAQDNIRLYTQIEEFMNNVQGLTAALTVEQKRAEDLEIKLKAAEKKLSKSQLRVRSGWYDAAATAMLAVVGYIGWAVAERPNVIQIVQKTTPVEPPVVIPEPLETVQYLMGAFLVELPDNQFVVTGKKNADLENRAKS